MKKILLFILFFCAGFLGYIQFKRPAISVVMSTYNRAAFLPHSIESILNQTFKDFEFIIINDGSTDKTAEVLSNYQRMDKRIRVITNETNLGLIASLNKGLDVAKGKYIARMDDDDKSVLTRFQLQHDFMEKNPSITVTGTRTRAYDDGLFVLVKDVHVEEGSDKTSIIAHFNVPILHPSAMIRHDFIKKHHIRYEAGYDSAEDTAFWFSIVKNGGKIVRLTPPLVVNSLTSPKKTGYYGNQLVSYAKFLNDKLKDIRKKYEFSARWLDRKEECFILQQLRKNPKEYYSIESVDLLLKEKNCVSKSAFLDFYGNYMLIQIDGDKYLIEDMLFTLIEKKENILILTYGDIVLEMKENNDDTYQVVSTKNVFEINHPDWKDHIFIKDENVVFISRRREAKLVYLKDNLLEIEFPKWGKERFEKGEDGTYNFKR